MDYEIQARKLAADARLRAATGTRPGPESMTKEQTATTVTAISDLVQALRYATTEDARPRSTRASRPGRGTRYPLLCAQLSFHAHIGLGARILLICAGARAVS